MFPFRNKMAMWAWPCETRRALAARRRSKRQSVRGIRRAFARCNRSRSAYRPARRFFTRAKFGENFQPSTRNLLWSGGWVCESERALPHRRCAAPLQLVGRGWNTWVGATPPLILAYVCRWKGGCADQHQGSFSFTRRPITSIIVGRIAIAFR